MHSSSPPDIRLSLVVNGAAVAVAVQPGTMLLAVLRERLGLIGAKPACERGECGACTVLLGETAILSCIIPAVLVDAPVTTVEGLADQALPLRAAFADRGAFQCGYCTSGQIVAAWVLLREGLPASREAAEVKVRERMSGNLCRCTGYNGIVDAVLDAAGFALPEQVG